MTPRPAPHIIRWFLRTFGYGGITLPPFAIFILAERINEPGLIRHEQAHWQQYQRMGAVRFYATYLWNNLRHGYRNNPMEIEAREAENP
jgi:hypothetical protein